MRIRNIFPYFIGGQLAIVDVSRRDAVERNYVYANKNKLGAYTRLDEFVLAVLKKWRHPNYTWRLKLGKVLDYGWLVCMVAIMTPLIICMGIV